jgi:cbb3-type cytochrome oxidase subunit 3
MKALTTFLFICLFPIVLFAQGTEKKDEVEKPEQELEEKDEPAEEVNEEEIHGENDEKSMETKSFTLDTNDAVLEEIVETENPDNQYMEQQTSTTYHYNGYKNQDDIQTLAGSHGHNGGFGAVSFTASEFNNKDIIMIGFRGGWIINRVLAVGFEGHGIIPTAEYEGIDPNNSLNSRSVGGYGGLLLEPIVLSNRVVHVTFPISAGTGWIGYIVDWEQNTNLYVDDLIDEDVFWYVQPGAALELNVARNFRINMGASYRFTRDLELLSTSTSAFDAWNYFISLKFGRF